ncbi:MAG: M48 family metalloprotease [Paracoccaceae bacterium]
MRSVLVILSLVVLGFGPVMAAPGGAGKPGATESPAMSAARLYLSVVAQIRPVAGRICRERAPAADCSIQIVLDARPGQAANAFQTTDQQGRALIVVNRALISKARNADELALVLGHEAAHQILGHNEQARENAFAGGMLGGVLAALSGGDAAQIERARARGKTDGVLRFAALYELEADRLGALIAFRAGFDPVRGAALYRRMPDPGPAARASHPPSKARLDAVRDTVARLR